jgi:hypothetical protein
MLLGPKVQLFCLFLHSLEQKQQTTTASVLFFCDPNSSNPVGVDFPVCQAHLGVLKFCEAVFELPSAEQIQLMMASNDMVSTVMYWIIWDLADCDLV